MRLPANAYKQALQAAGEYLPDYPGPESLGGTTLKGCTTPSTPGTGDVLRTRGSSNQPSHYQGSLPAETPFQKLGSSAQSREKSQWHLAQHRCVSAGARTQKPRIYLLMRPCGSQEHNR